ncbi:MAG: DUF1631 family protein [Clostridia bacterium]
MAGGTEAGSFERLLDECRDLVCGKLALATGAMLDKSDEALTKLISGTQSRDLQGLYQDTRKVLAGGRSKLEQNFAKIYVQEFDNRVLLARDPGQTFSALMTSTLSLVGEEALDETLKFKELAARLRRFCEEELAALDQRVGVLLGDANLSDEGNPLSPQTICDAYQQACHELDTTVKVRGVLRKLFDDHVVDGVRPIYKEVNELLVEHGILPKIRYGVTKKAESPKPAAGAPALPPEVAAAAAAAAPAGSEANVFAMLQGLLATSGIAAPALAPGQVPIQGAELLGSLTRIQQGDVAALPGGAAPDAKGNVLHGLKASVGAGMAQVDAMTLDIVAMLFDELFDDPKIPVGLKGLIGRLQIPMLKVAIADKSFFAKKSHPARTALDAFGEIALRLPGDFNASSALFPRLDAIVQRLLDGFQDDVTIFEGVQEELRGIISEDDQRVVEKTRAVAERVSQSESLAVAKGAAEDEVRSRVQGHALPGPVLEFLVEHWRKLLLLVHARHGAESQKWKDALQIMDQLVWSVEPKKTPEERRKLAATVPGLVKNIAAGMQALGCAEDVRSAFFNSLMQSHTAILSAKAVEDAKPAEALDFTAPVTVRNPYGAGEVQVAGVDDAPVGRAAVLDPSQKLVVGAWLEFKLEQPPGKRAAKVLFVTPKKTRYIFSDRDGKDMVEFSRAEIVRRLRTREAVLLDGPPEQPLFDRIMGGLTAKLRGKAGQPAPARAA